MSGLEMPYGPFGRYLLRVIEHDCRVETGVAILNVLSIYLRLIKRVLGVLACRRQAGGSRGSSRPSSGHEVNPPMSSIPPQR